MNDDTAKQTARLTNLRVENSRLRGRLEELLRSSNTAIQARVEQIALMQEAALTETEESLLAVQENLRWRLREIAMMVAGQYAKALQDKDPKAANDLLKLFQPSAEGRDRELQRLQEAGICEVTLHHTSAGAAGPDGGLIVKFL